MNTDQPGPEHIHVFVFQADAADLKAIPDALGRTLHEAGGSAGADDWEMFAGFFSSSVPLNLAQDLAIRARISSAPEALKLVTMLCSGTLQTMLKLCEGTPDHSLKDAIANYEGFNPAPSPLRCGCLVCCAVHTWLRLSQAPDAAKAHSEVSAICQQMMLLVKAGGSQHRPGD